ncbi:MAG: hypothetical protein EXS10_05170 [Phycisphaerales bacterium]|nr:hypothetical protein [Phycisphaerales bacterium]
MCLECVTIRPRTDHDTTMPSSRPFHQVAPSCGVLASKSWCGLLLLLCAIVVNPAIAQQDPPGSTPRIRARAPTTGTDIVRASLWIVEGKVECDAVFTLALVLEIAPTWHVFWRNPGDAGFAPSLSLQLPEGFVAVGDLAFPRPSILGKLELIYGYEGKIALLQRIQAPKSLPPEIALRATAKWMACKSTCLIGESELSVSVTPSVASIPRPMRDIVDAARFQMPTPLSEAKAWSVELVRDATGAVKTLSISGKTSVKVESPRPVIFIPDVTPGVTYGEGMPIAARFETVESASIASLSIPLSIEPANAAGKPLRAAGVILIGDGTHSSDHCYWVDVPIPILTPS